MCNHPSLPPLQFLLKFYNVFSGVGAYFGAQCEKLGMLVRVAGDNIMMCPPFIITQDELDEVRLFNCKSTSPP